MSSPTSRRPRPIEDQPLQSGEGADDGADEATASCQALFVNPHERRDGFWASIRGHSLDLADPGSGHALAPTPDDLFIASLASGLAWSARTLLRAHGLPDYVSVTARWRMHQDPPRLADIDLAVIVSRGAEAGSAALTAAFENYLSARSRAEPVVHVSLEGVN